MLPGIFRMDDPVVQVRFAPEGRVELERILAEIPEVAFTADDSLGWMYQFWQSKKKAEVNASERKIGGADLAPVTQLFTENYMVRFLLENSLGAWWAGKHPDSPLLKDYEYLRYKEDGMPAAGTFEGWPQVAAEVTVMDPCCGSGHFLVAAFEMLRQMRIAEEGLDAAEAGDAVIRDNLHGLELDLRATQIAAFSVALTAWKTGGYRELPILNIACSGIPVQGSLESWLKLAGGDDRLKGALTQLYNLFEKAPTLGSLIDPTQIGNQDPMFTANINEVEPLFLKSVEAFESPQEIGISIFGKSALDVSRVARYLSKKYVLLVTNVPYLGFKKQDDVLKMFCQENYSYSNFDLATVFIERGRNLTTNSGTYAFVTPHSWRYLISYSELRNKLLEEQEWNICIDLGVKAFRTPMWDFHIGLSVISNNRPSQENKFMGLEIENENSISEKNNILINKEVFLVDQKTQLSNPDSRITIHPPASGKPLENFVECFSGMLTGDGTRFYKYFWETQYLEPDWEFLQSTLSDSTFFGGMEYVVFWQKGSGELFKLAESLKHLNNAIQNWRRGQDAWGRKGVAISSMAKLRVSLYNGDKFDNNTTVICPSDEKHLPALWAFCESEEFNQEVRRIDKALKVTTSTFLKVPFDIIRWQEIASVKYPDGLPDPNSNDPTQWLFEGHPVDSTDPLHVAVARLLDYHWPEQEANELDGFSDEDGIVPLIAAGREEPAADRLRALLAVAYGEEWSPEKQRQLLAQVDYTGKTLEEWLRDGFFKQHVKLFKNRPFIWHIWDGRKDGFQVLVNYHKLDTGALDKLIYTYLGSWIELQRGHRNHGEPGADGRLVAALELKEKLEAIREGEPPYDIYVRWKDLSEQPIGWNPDLNDGVRLNIRPFVEAGVLRTKFTINWSKDRGKNPEGSERHNDLHYTNDEKRAARR